VTTPTPTDPLIGATVSQYEIVAKLGGGGMGVVYKARDTKLGRAVALKFLPPQWSHDESAKQRFVREAQAASATNHRNICVIHNIEETADGRLFIVMAHYEGETLKQKLERGALPIAEAIEIGSEIAEGLARAHGQGVVHRDVKPGNLMITDDGVKILDFGLAKFADALQLTVPGSTIGTVAYMSPEQARGEEADTRSDVWALGVVLYEMLAGSVPFRGSYPEATFHAIKNEPVPPLRAARPDTPEPLERIVMKALEKDPEKRFQTAREPARDLKLLAGRTVPLDLRTEEVVRPVGLYGEPPDRKSRMRRVATPMRLAFAAALLLAIAGGTYFWMMRPVERIRVAVAPVANHTGNTELDQYRLALTSTLIDEISESPNLKVVPYLRLVEMIRPFLSETGDLSSNDAIARITVESGAPFLVLPTLVYRDRDSTWLIQIQVRNAATGTTVASYETAPVTSSLSQQTAFRLVTIAADNIQQHFKANGPGRSFQQRSTSSRFREPDAARAFAHGLVKYDELEYSAALNDFSRAATLDDQHALTQAWLSRVYLILNRKNEAVAAGQRAKALVGANVSKSDEAFVSAVLAESQADLNGAEKAYRTLVALEPDDPWAHAELADFLKRPQDRNQVAIEAYHELLRIDPAYIRPHVDLCQLYNRIDDHPLAEKESQLAIARYRAGGIKEGEGQALLCLGEAQREQGGAHLNDARQNVKAARELIASLDQPYGLSRAVFYEASVEYSAGQLQAAEKFFEEASVKTRAVGNRSSEGTALMNLGVVNFYLGHPTRAVDFYRQSRKVFLDLGDERRVSEADVNAAGVEIDYGANTGEALKTLANARANLERLGYVDFQLVAMETEADSHRYAGRLDRARALLRTALEIARDKQFTGKITSLTLALARAHLQANDYMAARGSLEAVASGDPQTVDEAKVAMGIVLTRLGDTVQARDLLDRALIDIEAHQLSGLLPLVHTAIGELAYETRQAPTARAHFDQAIGSWTDRLPNAATIEAQCYRATQDALDGRTNGTRDLDAAVEQARLLGRLSLEALCRSQRARVDVTNKRYAEALAVLKAIPDDSEERTIGAELRAQVEHWRGRALAALGESVDAARSARAVQQLQNLQSALPEGLRTPFASRPDIALILRSPDVQSHP
jgi:tetratricopeptide (TPR) repeat protein/tRNA A-37 threonylcarbamoyl transferase component Bud32